MDKLLPCPFCGGESFLYGSGAVFWIGCVKCRVDTPIFETEEKAITVWNRRSKLENEPLTLEELRGMVGEWVWVEHMASPASRAEPGEWIKLKSCSPTRSRPYVDFENKGLCFLYYGQAWLAYRYKPERSEG